MGKSIRRYYNNLAEVFEQDVSLDNKHRQLMELGRLIKDDPQAKQLLDAFLDACFDSVQPPEWAPVIHWENQTLDHAERIAAALDALNTHLKQSALLPEGIVPPPHFNLKDWAEDITMNILTNSSF